MSCFRNQEFIKTTEEEILKITPLGEGKSVGYWKSTEKYPDGLIAIGKFSNKKEKDGIYFYHDLQHYNKRTLKKEFKIRRTTRHFIDKNGVCHTQYIVGNAQRTGAFISVSGNSTEEIISGSTVISPKHYESLKVLRKRLTEKTCEHTVTELIKNKLVYYVKYFYE